MCLSDYEQSPDEVDEAGEAGPALIDDEHNEGLASIALSLEEQIVKLRKELSNSPYVDTELRDIDAAALSPRETLDALYDLQEKSDDEWHKEWNH